ncbi:hypothetical protein ZIOFF_065556 [Zingiber officinale]|uniref:dUTP diphosphatase n=1 Tax=Zingiber officinale TaxID=94328 RepID=A0A8J5EXF9_ZINOF|nr:hypothetical protein ZIOFF_065556 [Zingiber officinale]
MSYINTQATNSYKEALQATEAIEAPSLGFCKPTDYKGALSGTFATIKQANTQIQLLVTILEKLESLEDRIKKIEAKANPEGKGERRKREAIGIQRPLQVISRTKEAMNTRVTTNPPVTTERASERNPLFEDQIRDYRPLPGRRYDTRELMGQNWIIIPSTVTLPLQPTEVTTNNLIDGRISLHFNNYQAARTPTPPRYNSRDNEENDEEEQMYTIAVLTLDEEAEEVFYIKKISGTAKTPRRASKGAAGYDLAVDQDYLIPPQGQELLSTGISIKTPEGTYARIAPRSSYAMKGIIIGADVIDSDYRGEVKILVHNFSNDTLSFKTGECIAQIILECCKTPMIMPVRELDNTSRGHKGFGSTSLSIQEKEQRIAETTQRRTELLQAREQKQKMADKQSLKSARQYRQEIWQKHFTNEDIWDLLQPHTSKSIEEPGYIEFLDQRHFLCVNTLDIQDDYISYLQYLMLQETETGIPHFSSDSSDDFVNPFAVEDGGKMPQQQPLQQLEGQDNILAIGSPTIEFLGATIGQSTIKLQPHVISKIADFKEQELSTTKGPLYAKTSPTGEKKMNFQDLELIRKIKKIIKELPDLSIPPNDCFIIIEADGCMEGWGGICKWKPKKTMDSCGEGSSNTSPDRGSLTTDQGQTQFDGIPTPSGPYELLQQYEELACDTGKTSIYNQEEHDKRSHMADIEWTATKHILSSIRELELICQLKESDFRKRSHYQGQDTYWQKALPAVNEARIELFKVFIHMQRIAQLIRKNPP